MIGCKNFLTNQISWKLTRSLPDCSIRTHLFIFKVTITEFTILTPSYEIITILEVINRNHVFLSYNLMNDTVNNTARTLTVVIFYNHCIFFVVDFFFFVLLYFWNLSFRNIIFITLLNVLLKKYYCKVQYAYRQNCNIVKTCNKKINKKERTA